MPDDLLWSKEPATAGRPKGVHAQKTPADLLSLSSGCQTLRTHPHGPGL